MVYISFFIILFIFACLQDYWNEFFFKIASIAVLLLVCLRSQSIGIDSAGGFFKYYTYISEGIDLYWVEPLWIYLNKFVIFLGLGYQGVLALSGLLTLIPVYYVINKTCRNKCFALAIYYGLYFVLFSFNIMRQNIAISFVLLASYLYVQKKYYVALLSACVAVLFHSSTVIALPLMLFFKMNVDLKKMILLFTITYFTGILLNDQFFFIISGGYATNLLQDDGYTGFRNSILIPALFCLIFNIFFTIILFPEFNKIKKNPWFLMVLLGILVMNLTMRLGQGTRVVLFFSQAQAIFIPNYIRRFEREQDKIIICFLYVAFIGANFIRMLLEQWEHVCPYRFFLQ